MILTPGGRAVLAVGAISFVAGVDPFRTQLNGLFVMATALLLVSLLGVLRRPRLTGEWTLPPRAGAGLPIPVTVTVGGKGIDLDATLAKIPRGLTASSSTRVGVLDDRAVLKLELMAHKRGAYTVGPAYAGTTWPFGLLRWGRKVGARKTLLVTPKVHHMYSLQLNPGLRYQPGGVPLASQTGESLEFMGVREYRQGDSPRKIHWKLWARRGQPVVREYGQEYFSRVGLILDTYLPKKHFEEAVETAASVAGFLARQEAIVDFFAAGPTVYFLSVGRHLGTLQSILDVLACVTPCKEAPYGKVEAQIAGLLPNLSALVLVTFAPNPERREFWNRLQAFGTPLRILAVGSGSEPEATWLDPRHFPTCLEHL